MKLFIRSIEKGFTLFEVIFIAASLSLGFLMVLQIFPLGLRAKEAAEQCSIATLLAQQIIEEAKREGYENLGASSSPEGEDYGIRKGKFEIYEGYQYRLEWRDSETPNLRELRVRILFNDSGIKRKEIDGHSKNHLDNEDDSWQQCLELVTYLAKKE